MDDVYGRANNYRIVTRRNSGGIHRSNWNRSTVEVTKDGLRELERMMKEQKHRRSARLAKSLLDQPGQTPGCDVSPESLSSDTDSRLSLDASLNLSEEV
ncbi:hypothetical protein PoB_002576200 [Plakobranchus ocellatus]|uniref:Uncharacterized protein n=1 Tax=Plakobranchus ocellatus TaxID=259542 RepID=A0AAV3ZW12_9GAST|nr:hypothetical protein PoB_002576200 [Plakobranchus ocellatus]